MAVSVFTLIDRSVSNMGAVHPKVKDLAIELIKRAYHEGIYVQITSGYRSNAEQTRLYNQGRTTAGNIVTNAGPGQSVHNYGYAIDFVLVSEDGSRAIWEVNRDWRRVAAIGKQLGFQWGGDWTSFRDYPHLDVGGLSWRQLQAGRRPRVPNVPERSYLGAGDSGPKVEALQEYLNQVGIKVDVDSDYGPATEAAVKLFQEKRSLTADGFYGPGSLAEMNEALDELKEPEVKPAAVSQKEEEITMADLLKLTTNEGKNAQLRVLRRFEQKDPALATIWREKAQSGEFTVHDGLEVIFVAIDRGYITGLVDTEDLAERVEALESDDRS